MLAVLFLAIILAIPSLAHAAYPWEGGAVACTGITHDDYKNTRPPGKIMVGKLGTITWKYVQSKWTGYASATVYPLKYPYTDGTKLDYSYPYKCELVDVKPVPETNEVAVWLGVNSTYSDWTLSRATVTPYTNPAGAGSGSLPTGYGFPQCAIWNQTWAQLNTIKYRYCFTQSYRWNAGGECFVAYTPSAPSGLDIMLFGPDERNYQGTLCTDVYRYPQEYVCRNGVPVSPLNSYINWACPNN